MLLPTNPLIRLLAQSEKQRKQDCYVFLLRGRLADAPQKVRPS